MNKKFRAQFTAGAGGEGGAGSDPKITDLLKDIEAKLEKGLDQKAMLLIKKETEEIKANLEALGTKADKTEIEAVKALADGIQETLDLLDVKVQKMNGLETQEKTRFNDVLASVLADNAEKLSNFKSGEMVLEMKAADDMGIDTNYPTATDFFTDRSRGLFVPPSEQVFLGDILPGANGSGPGFSYPEFAGGEGEISEWDGTDEKVQIDYDFITRNVTYSWLAGVVIVERAMLDDVPWLTSFLQSRLLLDLKIRENAFILNRAVTGLLAKATAYDGTFTNSVDRLVDAAYGQIPEDTFSRHRATHFVMRPRATVDLGLNKAAGSGEYDLPAGTVGFRQGALELSGIRTVATTSIPAGQFLAMDANATLFVKRLQPELRVFEDATLARQNKVMFRIEERVATAVIDPKALVKGPLVAPPAPEPPIGG